MEIEVGDAFEDIRQAWLGWDVQQLCIFRYDGIQPLKSPSTSRSAMNYEIGTARMIDQIKNALYGFDIIVGRLDKYLQYPIMIPVDNVHAAEES